jgi:hypothetical protein
MGDMIIKNNFNVDSKPRRGDMKIQFKFKPSKEIDIMQPTVETVSYMMI